MFRKIAIAVSAVLLGLVVVCYTNLPGLAHVKFNDSMAWLDSQVPIETQIKQLKLQVGKIDGEIKNNVGKLAAMEVENDKLEQKIVALKADQGKAKTEMAALTKSLDDNTQKVTLRERDNRASQLENLVGTYKVNQNKVKLLEDMLAAKRETFENAHKKIMDMKDQRDQLQLTIEKLESRKEVVDLKTQQTQIQVSDSALAESKALAQKIDDRLTLQEKTADKMGEFGYGSKVAPTKNTKSVKDVVGAAKEILEQDESDK